MAWSEFLALLHQASVATRGLQGGVHVDVYMEKRVFLVTYVHYGSCLVCAIEWCGLVICCASEVKTPTPKWWASLELTALPP